MGQIDCLNDFISRNNLKTTWKNINSMKDFTYTHFSWDINRVLIIFQ